jgi:hypothetical protein
MRLFILLFILIFINTKGLGQDSITCNKKDTLMLLSGQFLVGSFVADTFGNVDYCVYKGKRQKIGQISRDRVFGIRSMGVDKYIYSPDPLIENDFSIPEMKGYVWGQQDALRSYKGHYWLGALGGVISYTTVLLDTYMYKSQADRLSTEPGFFKSAPSFLPFLIPIVYLPISILPKPRVRKCLSDQNYYGDKIYYSGFLKGTRKKRLVSSIIGSFSGIALGLVSYYAFSPNR